MSDFQELFCGQLKKYNDVIIYGYADIGTLILDYIIEFETSIKIANYSGRVKYFASSEKTRSSIRMEVKGIKIKSIYELTDYAKTALIIIATQEKNHKDIEKVLDELGFQNRLYISHEDYCVARKEVEEYRTTINNNLQNYHLNHQIKLNRIREKAVRGKKIKVFFMTHDAAVFGCESVYRSMMEDNLFEPYIYVVSRRDVGYAKYMEDVDKDIEFFEKQGYRVIKVYDEYGTPRDLHVYAPDILFYDIPKLYGAAGPAYNRLDLLNWEYLTCYVPYGLMMVDSFYYHYHTKCIRETWRFFVDTAADFKRVLSDGDFNGYNTVLAGYPKLDDYRRTDFELPEKLKNGKPIVIYAPHHSLFASNNFATFDLYKDFMMNMVKSNPDYNFVIKPHPLLPYQIDARYREGKIDFSREEYEKYIAEWNNLPNGCLMDQGEYIGLFKACKCMITDCGSFIGEFLPSLKPCIYLFNPRKKKQMEVYTPLAQKILDTYYVTKNAEELSENLQRILGENIDIKYTARKQVLQEQFGNIGYAGKYICEYLHTTIAE